MYVISATICVILIVIDQASKYLALTYLKPVETIPIIQNIFSLGYFNMQKRGGGVIVIYPNVHCTCAILRCGALFPISNQTQFRHLLSHLKLLITELPWRRVRKPRKFGSVHKVIGVEANSYKTMYMIMS